jgi:hypothetical protein
MSNWIVENLNAKQGKYPEKAYQMAFRELYADRLTADAKIESAKKVAESFTKAKPVSGDNGSKEPDLSLSPEEKEEELLAARIKARRR